jgi:hypothetical protein
MRLAVNPSRQPGSSIISMTDLKALDPGLRFYSLSAIEIAFTDNV